MIGTPVRWLLMIGVAACGLVMVTDKNMLNRGFAFVASVFMWQAHFVVLLWEAEMWRKSGLKRIGAELSWPPVGLHNRKIQISHWFESIRCSITTSFGRWDREQKNMVR